MPPIAFSMVMDDNYYFIEYYKVDAVLLIIADHYHLPLIFTALLSSYVRYDTTFQWYVH